MKRSNDDWADTNVGDATAEAGISYYVVNDDTVDTAGPIVERLSGT